MISHSLFKLSQLLLLFVLLRANVCSYKQEILDNHTNLLEIQIYLLLLAHDLIFLFLYRLESISCMLFFRPHSKPSILDKLYMQIKCQQG